MKRFLYLFAVLAACDTPSPAFWGAAVDEIEVDGSYFDVRQRADVAEAIRVNADGRPDISVIARRAELAIEKSTGCNVKSLYGDVAMLTGQLDCKSAVDPDNHAVWRQRPKVNYTCLGWRNC